MSRENCWEVMRCGREPGGVNASMGICPAAVPGEHDGENGGEARGRICWTIDGVLCPSLEGITGKGPRLRICLDCEFLTCVMNEEGRDFVLMPRRDAEPGTAA